jgi:hypothetical protein
MPFIFRRWRSSDNCFGCLFIWLICQLAPLPGLASEAAGGPLPSFAELEAAGATIGLVRVNVENIFDMADPREDNFVFRTVNFLHIPTRPGVVEKSLLFKSGQKLSVRLIDETERLLRTNRYLYDVQIRPVAYRDGMVDIEVVTRDTWSLDIAGKLSRSGGTNNTSFGLKEYNLLGTGLRFGVARTSDADRRGSEFEFAYPQAFDGWTRIDFSQGRYSDGSRQMASVVRPFYALDTPWAAGVTWDKQDRIDSIYNAGETAGQYRHRSRTGEAFGGWSAGLVDGWTQRYSAGVFVQDDAYLAEPGRSGPVRFPVNHVVRSVFVRHEMIEDRYVKLKNRDQIARVEYVALGFNSTVQLTRSVAGWGASQSAWLYQLRASHGVTLPWRHDFLTSISLERRIGSTGAPLTQSGMVLRYYAPQGNHATFFASLAGDQIGPGGGVPDQLLLGGDNGLRGYPLRYQSGDRRALLTLEQRAYSDWYPFRLLRIGGAVFYDYGRAWTGGNQNIANSGWLSDIGIGLRIALDRSAFSNVLHADIAMPLNRPPGIKAVQYLMKTEISF